jgi:hypothetical protein
VTPAALAALRSVCIALSVRCAKTLLSCSHAGVKNRLSYAAEQRRKAFIVIPRSPSTDLQGIAVPHTGNPLALQHCDMQGLINRDVCRF